MPLFYSNLVDGHLTVTQNDMWMNLALCFHDMEGLGIADEVKKHKTNDKFWYKFILWCMIYFILCCKSGAYLDTFFFWSVYLDTL
ncbi:hypothetical protein RchiOBHm_Chr5g0049601 [Rosa chinensis]|uniref:Uncharacterized protein n=2 Tax=Rosa chinensis TaxID=74649 RepID=A0A2P6QEV9_ROSCH|nr:hypothetical protein RchiOBHm_Chr5g0049601 [Rosa chinensis]